MKDGFEFLDRMAEAGLVLLFVAGIFVMGYIVAQRNAVIDCEEFGATVIDTVRFDCKRVVAGAP